MSPVIARFLKIIGYGVASVVGLVVAVVLLLSFLMPDLCGNSVVAEFPSPNGRWKAVVFSRDCGATTDFSTQVSLLKAGDSLANDGGNLFVADRDHGKAPAGPSGGPAVAVRWVSDGQLRVEHHSLARVFKAEALRQNVKIEYAVIQEAG